MRVAIELGQYLLFFVVRAWRTSQVIQFLLGNLYLAVVSLIVVRVLVFTGSVYFAPAPLALLNMVQEFQLVIQIKVMIIRNGQIASGVGDLTTVLSMMENGKMVNLME